MKSHVYKTALIASLSLLSLVSCRKEEKQNLDLASGDNALAESNFEDANNISDEGSTSTSLEAFKTDGVDESTAILSGCATVTHDTLVSPKSMTIDFGAVNCTGADGKNRRGKIIVTYTGKYRATGTVITTTFDNYFVNDNQITGTRTVTNNGLNAAGNPTFSIVTSGSIILADGSGTIVHSSTRSREWIAGFGTLRIFDDEYAVTGSGSGTSAAGIDFTVNITVPLIRKIERGCRHFVSGVLEFTPDGKPTRTVDYGSGTCDNEAVVTVGRRTKTITLR